jgi:hypothetical protein
VHSIVLVVSLCCGKWRSLPHASRRMNCSDSTARIECVALATWMRILELVAGLPVLLQWNGGSCTPYCRRDGLNWAQVHQMGVRTPFQNSLTTFFCLYWTRSTKLHYRICNVSFLGLGATCFSKLVGEFSTGFLGLRIFTILIWKNLFFFWLQDFCRWIP